MRKSDSADSLDSLDVIEDGKPRRNPHDARNAVALIIVIGGIWWGVSTVRGWWGDLVAAGQTTEGKAYTQQLIDQQTNLDAYKKATPMQRAYMRHVMIDNGQRVQADYLEKTYH